MPRKSETAADRRDGCCEPRYIKTRKANGTAMCDYVSQGSNAEAQRAQSEVCVQCGKLQSDADHTDPPETVEQYLDRWLQSIRHSVRKSTYANYDGLIRRHIVPAIGETPLFQVSSSMIQRYINQKLDSGRLDGKGGLSVKTAQDIVGLLKRSLNAAGIELNINLPKYSLPMFRVLTQQEQRALITAAQAVGNAESLGVLISLFTGLRIGELCSLKWNDISFQEGVLKVSKTLQRIENCESDKRRKTVIEMGTPLNKGSIRNVPLAPFLLCQLAQLKASAHDDDYILSGNCRYVEPRLCQYRFKKLVKSAGIDDINFNALRHTFAARCLELEMDAKTISEILGYSNSNTILERYVQVPFERQRDCLEKLSRFL